jgi:PRTRC genetic system protein F
MRHRNLRAHREVQTEFSHSGATAAAVVRRPRDPLRIPRRIEAPAKFVANTLNGAALASFALALYDAGFVSETDQGIEIDKLVKTGLERVHRDILGELDHVDEIGLVVSTTLEGLECYTSNDDDDPKQYWIGIDLGNGNAPVSVGDKLKQLEALMPGLGQTVLDTLETAGAKTTGCWSPRFVRETASYTHWMGANTQEEWLEELEMYNSDPEEAVFGPGEYDSYFDESWVIDPAQPLDPFALLQCLEEEEAGVAAITEKVLEMQCLIKEGAHFTSAELTDRETVYRGVWIRWDDDDPTQQVLDDYINYANQGADCYTTLCSVWEVEATQEGFAQWLKGYMQGLKLYKTLDQLLWLLSCVTTGDQDVGNNESE